MNEKALRKDSEERKRGDLFYILYNSLVINYIQKAVCGVPDKVVCWIYELDAKR